MGKRNARGLGEQESRDRRMTEAPLEIITRRACRCARADSNHHPAKMERRKQ
jgi:hypothetical protein